MGSLHNDSNPSPARNSAMAPRTPTPHAPNTPSGGGGGGGGDRPKVRRVPDVDILKQLCRQHLNHRTGSAPKTKGSSRGGVLAIASEADLWTILHKRYGGSGAEGDGNTAATSKSGRITVLLNILQQDDAPCRDPAWSLMGYLTQVSQDQAQPEASNAVAPQEQLETQIHGRLAEQIMVEISHEFDRDSYGSDLDACDDAKRFAAQTLFHLLKNEENCVDSPVLSSLQSMSPSRRHHWITVLLDMLMFQGDEDDQLHNSNQELNANSSTGTAENLFVVWNLLLSQPFDGEEPVVPEDGVLLMKTIVGIAVSILSSAEGGDGVYSNSEKGSTTTALSVLQAESALGLLATVASRAGATALAGRQYECMRTISETAIRYDDEPDVLLQGAHAIYQMLASFEWYRGPAECGAAAVESDQEAPPNLLAVEHVMDVLLTILQLQEKRAAHNLRRLEELNQATCRLLTALLESDDAMQTFVVESCLPRGPELVQALVVMIETTELLAVGESASDILVYLLKKDFATSGHLRGIPDIASIVVHVMDRYRDAPFIQENLCWMVAHLVSLEDHRFGQEIGESGGLSVLGDLLLHSGEETALVESALRALIGTVSSVDLDLLLTYQASLTEVIVSVMENNERVLEVQVAALDALHCLCVRVDGPSKNHLARALPMVVQAMEDYLANAGVLTRCCAILRMVARAFEDRGVFVQTGAVRMLINAMLIHPDATEFVLEGMATLKDLAADASFREHFDYADAEACLLSLLEVNATAPDVVAPAFATLNNVLVDFHSRTVAPLQTVVLQHIVAALKAFPDHETVWTNAFLLLKSYTYSDNNLAMMQDYSDTLIPLLVDSERLLAGDSLERAKYIIRKLQ